MKETYMIKADGTKVYTRDDNAPQMRKVMGEQKSQGSNMNLLRQKLGGQKPQGNPQNVAQMGRRGDTELAHVNPYEKMILKKMGGSGAINPRTGLREFAPASSDPYWANQYLQQYPDVASSSQYGNPEMAFQHYLQYGYNEGRNWPGPIQPSDVHAPFNYADYNFPTASATGTTGATAGAPASSAPSAGGTNFDFPMDIMPSSSSKSSSSSYTGLPEKYRNDLLSAITPQLQQAIANMPQNIDTYTNEALGSYQQMMQNALRNNLPKAIAGLANRGIINSTEGQNVLSQTMSDAAIDASNKGYQTAMQQALLKANMPTVLGQLAELGKYSSGTGSSQSEDSDPTKMYQIMANLIAGMM